MTQPRRRIRQWGCRRLRRCSGKAVGRSSGVSDAAMGWAALDVRGLRGRFAAVVSSLGQQLDSCCLGTSSDVEGGRLVEQCAGNGEFLFSFLPFFDPNLLT